MAYEQRELSGALFKNDRKQKETHPDYKGDAKIDGVAYEIGAWLKPGKKGTFMSLSFKPKQSTQANDGMGEYQGEQATQPSLSRRPPPASRAPVETPPEDSIPF